MAVLIPTSNGDIRKKNIYKFLCNRLERPVKLLKGGQNFKYDYTKEVGRKIQTNNVQTQHSKQMFKSLIPVPCQNINIKSKQPPKKKSHYTQSLIPLMVTSKKKFEQTYNIFIQGDSNNLVNSKHKILITRKSNYPIQLNTKLIKSLCQNLKPLNWNVKLCDITNLFILQEDVKLLKQLIYKKSPVIFDTTQIIKNPSLLMLPIMNTNFNRQVGLLTKYFPHVNNDRESLLICSITPKVDNLDSSNLVSISSSSLDIALNENLDQLNTIITNIDSSCNEAETFIEGRNYYYNFKSDFERKSKTTDCIVEVFSEKLKVNALCRLIDNIFGGLLNDFEDYKKAFLLSEKCSFPRFDWMFDKNLHSTESKLDPPPIVLNIRRIGPWSILVKWTMPTNKNIVGYEICINGVVKYRVLSAERQRAILDCLNLKSANNISIYAMSIFGRCYPPAVATYNML